MNATIFKKGKVLGSDKGVIKKVQFYIIVSIS